MAEDIVEVEVLNRDKIYQNDMLLDYINGKKPMIDYFEHTPKKLHDTSFKGDRGILKELLLKYNKSIDASDSTITNIEMVENENVRFVITGQQPGIFTGPLYTLYKTIAAINYANKYSTKDLHLMPLFWNASEDHDVEEVNSIQVLDKDNNIIPIEIDTSGYFGKSLERISLNKKKINSLIENLISIFPDTDFSDELFNELLKKELKKSEKWGEYFSRLLSKLMAKWGLIIIEPYILRPYLKDYFTKLLTNPVKYNKIFLKSTEQLGEIGYKPKMHKKEEIVGLFYIDEENNRHSITIDEKGLYKVNTELTFTKEEIQNKLEENPNDFSTNAIYRPIAQDHIFPTYLFVGGPSEIGYHLQLKDLYKEFKVTQPNLFFRMGATVIERHVNKVIEKYNFKIAELLDINKLTKKLLVNEKDNFLGKYFGEIAKSFDGMTKELKEFNSELGSRVSHKKGTIMKELNEIRNMYVQYAKRDNEILVQQIEKAHQYLFPSNKPQERVFNIFQYINKYSFDILGCMKSWFSKVDPGMHVVLKCWML